MLYPPAPLLGAGGGALPGGPLLGAAPPGMVYPPAPLPGAVDGVAAPKLSPGVSPGMV
jgi:hypothetical protein